MKKIITIICVLILSLSCKKDNGCEGIACFTPPNNFYFELIDASTGENLFTKGTYTASQLKVIDLENQNAVDFQFISENNYNIIELFTIGWKTETINYSITISDKSIFELYVDAKRVSGACCNYTEYKEIKISNSEFEFNQQTGVYTIFVN